MICPAAGSKLMLVMSHRPPRSKENDFTPAPDGCYDCEKSVRVPRDSVAANSWGHGEKRGQGPLERSSRESAKEPMQRSRQEENKQRKECASRSWQPIRPYVHPNEPLVRRDSATTSSSCWQVVGVATMLNDCRPLAYVVGMARLIH